MQKIRIKRANANRIQLDNKNESWSYRQKRLGKELQLRSITLGIRCLIIGLNGGTTLSTDGVEVALLDVACFACCFVEDGEAVG